MADESFKFVIKTVVWSEYELSTPILLQDANGPCPLIALINTLLMKSDLETFNLKIRDQPVEPIFDEIAAFKSVIADKSTITLPELLSQLAHLLIAFSENASKHYDVDNLLSSLPLLHTGLSINPNLTKGEIYQDLAYQLFDIFNLKIKHGWIASPEDDTSFSKISELQYFDAIQDLLLTDSDSVQGVKHWLDSNQTQLTQFGLKSLDESLDNNELIVFFRNNHFSTLLKRNTQDLYLLVTDSGFDKRSKIVWQSLISASGKEDLFFTGDFVPVFEDVVDGNDSDIALVRQLQEQEDELLAKQMQKKYETRQQTQSQPTKKKSVNSKDEPSSKKNGGKDKKSFCSSSSSSSSSPSYSIGSYSDARLSIFLISFVFGSLTFKSITSCLNANSSNSSTSSKTARGFSFSVELSLSYRLAALAYDEFWYNDIHSPSALVIGLKMAVFKFKSSEASSKSDFCLFNACNSALIEAEPLNFTDMNLESIIEVSGNNGQAFTAFKCFFPGCFKSLKFLKESWDTSKEFSTAFN